MFGFEHWLRGRLLHVYELFDAVAESVGRCLRCLK